MFKRGFITILLLAFSWQAVFAGTSGKIAGHVSDIDTGEPLIGVNITLRGTNMGAATDQDGYYVILNVPPGLYDITADAIGYAIYIVQGVRVEIDLTTPLDFQMKTEVLVGEEVVVTADTRIIKRDVAGSQLSISSQRVQNLPVTSVSQVLGLQAGVTSGLSVRGSGSSEVLFIVDGVSLRDERNNTPITGIPLSAVQEISVQTGGFGVEYQEVRSGVVNVVTREGSPEHYSGTITMKYSPPAPKHFGISPYDPNAFFLRPYIDPEVCWTGTRNGAWDEYTQDQYPRYNGWNADSESTLQDDDPDNDLTPAAAQRIFLWQHRKNGYITEPDYNIDAGFGGPIPLLSKALGDLRFFASFREEREMYLMPLSRDALTEQSVMVKVTSDLTPKMKLTLLGLKGTLWATTTSGVGGTGYFNSAWEVASLIDRIGHTANARIFVNDYWARTAVYENAMSAKLTHIVSPTTFYEILVKQVGKNYDTGPGPVRDTTLYEIADGIMTDEGPFGYQELGSAGIDGMMMGGSISTARDSSRFITTTAKFDLVSQVGSNHQVSAGLEFISDDFQMIFGQVNKALPDYNRWTRFRRTPYRGIFYMQDKLEFEGFIATVGMNMEYSNPNGMWYTVSDPFDAAFYSTKYDPVDEENIPQEPAEARLTLSPRLAVSHPITVDSKLYFNYGHYRQMPTSDLIYRVQRHGTNKVERVGDPTLPLPKTVAYELGYDQVLFNSVLLHLAAYYKDISEQESWIRYIGSMDASINYRKLVTNSYEDIRGFEIELIKNYGQWLTGNINYEYRVGTSGYFGWLRYHESTSDQRDYLRQNPPTQSKPRPRPRFKANIGLHTPAEYGPVVSGQRILGDWNLNFIATWVAGGWFTWNPTVIEGLQYNVQWKPYHNVNLRVSKTFAMGNMKLKLFLDVSNLLNHKDFSGESFFDYDDYTYYMSSLHLPKEVADELGVKYYNIPGDDQPGEVRVPGAEYVPMEWIADPAQEKDPNSIAIYYSATGEGFTDENSNDQWDQGETFTDVNKNDEYDGPSSYWQYEDGAWKLADSQRLQQVLDNKAYIDMPNHTYFTFLNPRDFYFGVNVSFDLR